MLVDEICSVWKSSSFCICQFVSNNLDYISRFVYLGVFLINLGSLDLKLGNKIEGCFLISVGVLLSLVLCLIEVKTKVSNKHRIKNFK